MNVQRYNRISIILDEFQIDQKDLAALLSVSKDTVSRWCRNENQPRIPELFKIAGLFRIDASRLLEPINYSDTTGLSPVETFKLEKTKAKNREKDSRKKKSKKRIKTNR